MESKEEIRQRLLRSAARAWGMEESRMDLEAFDPLVRLMVEAQAGEFARLDRRLFESQERILEQLLEQLSPEILTGPKAAHAVAVARSIRPMDVVDVSHQMIFNRDTGPVEEQLTFMPLADYTVFDCAVKVFEVGGKTIFSQSPNGARETIVRDGNQQSAIASTIHLGLEINHEITDLSGMQFYLHWLNAANQDELSLYLRMAQWSLNGHPISIKHGLYPRRRSEQEEVDNSLSDEYSRYARSKREIEDQYAENFITLDGLDENIHGTLPSNLRKYPEVFVGNYPEQELAELKQELLWISIAFPTQLPARTLETTICAVNAFPIVNFTKHRSKGYVRDQVNIVPLPTDDYYFDVIRVENAAGAPYHRIPLSNIRDYEVGQYSIRKRDVGKLDKRAASLALMNMLDMLRDESSAFSAYGLDVMNSKITELNQNIKGLEQVVTDQSQANGHLAFLVAKPNPKDLYITVDYLSSAGERGNGILGESKLQLKKSGRIDRKAIFMLTTSRGGAKPLSKEDRKYAYKKAIISRGRVVSREDIRAFAGAHFVNELIGVDIGQGYHNGLGPWQGLIRTIEVTLRFTTQALELNDPSRLAIRIGKLEKELNRNTSSVLPIKVLSADFTISEEYKEGTV